MISPHVTRKTATVRIAQLNDAEAIAHIGRVAFADQFGYLFTPQNLAQYLDETYAVAKIESGFGHADNRFFVSEIEGRVSGFLKLKLQCPHPAIDSSDAIQLQKMYVLPELQGFGAGRLLMQAAFRCLSGPELLLPMWLLVHVDNVRAHQFYEKAGFQRIGFDHWTYQDQTFDFALMSKQSSKK